MDTVKRTQSKNQSRFLFENMTSFYVFLIAAILTDWNGSYESSVNREKDSAYASTIC